MGATERATRRVVARARAAKGAGAPRWVWHVERSEDTGRAWSGPPVDLVFIDGDHTREGCTLDWELWNGHVAIGGHVVFHDARDAPGGAPGIPAVIAVVDELFREGGGTPGWEIVREVDRAVAVQRVLGA